MPVAALQAAAGRTCVSPAEVRALKLMLNGRAPLCSRRPSRAEAATKLLPTPVVPVSSTGCCTSRHACDAKCQDI